MRINCNKKNIHFSFSAKHEPIAYIDDGARITLETLDASNMQINGSGTFDELIIECEKFLPVTGPIYVKGCDVGDVLKIKILKINLDLRGHLWSRPGNGVLRIDNTAYSEQVIVNQEAGTFSFESMCSLSFPINSMVGIIGVAPDKGEEIATKYPGTHGGNLDTVYLKEGSTIWLPIKHKGGLLSAGDLHAAMGEGEICGTGVEIGGEIDIEVHVQKETILNGPMITIDDKVILLSSGDDCDDIVNKLVVDGINYIQDNLGITKEKAYLLLSAIGDLKIAQVVNPLKTLSLVLPNLMKGDKYKVYKG